ncbi:flagellar protein FliT [Enterobacter oligotrophicus]|uniref:flagellar protein FliT n=1 Tax=Enterobacter TaxID=547 RepID=UPI001C02A8AD|nr:flagellar protein FliT [Enterobacter oligotrophicus]MBT9427255.1 flagellar protein FliT [Enterobacter oligotrophicus]
MDDMQVMHYLARSLRHSASQHDWPKMQDVDAQIAALLTSLKGQTLSAEKREALEELRQTHAMVSRFCQEQSDELEQKMARARRNKEGATAYAQFASVEDFGR